MKKDVRRKRGAFVVSLVGSVCLLALVGTLAFAVTHHTHTHAASKVGSTVHASNAGGDVNAGSGYFADPCGDAPAAIDDQGDFHCNPPAQPSYHVAEFWAGNHDVDVTVLNTSWFLGGTYTDHYSPGNMGDYDSSNTVQFIAVY